VAFGTGHVKTVVDTMKERNIPPYVGDDYMAIAWPTTYRGIKNNARVAASVHRERHQADLQRRDRALRERALHRADERVERHHVDRLERHGVDEREVGLDLLLRRGHRDGRHHDPEEMRAKIPTDYGRSKGVAWYYLGGFGIAHTNATQARIVMWDSAS
jgi:hypothetical protein